MVYLFLQGAEMEPERVRAAWPEARFVARGRIQPRPRGAVTPPVGERYETWGILLETPDETRADSAKTRSAIADDGRIFAVTVIPPDDADPTAVLAAARYWELPPAYVRRLAHAASAPVEEYYYSLITEDGNS
jgi:hypothetical protein